MDLYSQLFNMKFIFKQSKLNPHNPPFALLELVLIKIILLIKAFD